MQQRIQKLLDKLVGEGNERGIQVAAYLGGRLVVDAWAGVADAATGRAVDGETLFPVFSATKALAATIVHRLVERGLKGLDHHMPIAEIWPAFGARGKERITLRHILSHSAGVPQMPAGIDYPTMGNWDAMCGAIADLEPLWPAGTRIEYHAMTFGWIVGEVACRAAGAKKTFEQLLDEEIRRPLGLKSMFVGIPDDVEPRVATLEEYGVEPLKDDGKPQSVPSVVWPLHEMMNRPDARRACIPATTGIMNARDLARHYAALLPGGVDGVELLPPARVKIATEMQRPDHPADDNWAKGWGLGYQVEVDETGGRPTLRSFGHGGYGGSIGRAYPGLGLAIGVTKNLFSKAGGQQRVIDELLSAAQNAARY